MNATASQGAAGTSLTSARRRLQLVEPSPEQILRDLFQCEDDILNQLHRCRLAQKEARQLYAKERGLLILPGLETLRKAIGK